MKVKESQLSAKNLAFSLKISFFQDVFYEKSKKFSEAVDKKAEK